MEINRRLFLVGTGVLSITGFGLGLTEAESLFYSGAKDKTGYAVFGISQNTLQAKFRFDIPGRAHGFAHRPGESDSVVFARRPGEFAIVFNRSTGEQIASIDSKSRRHFYGHGIFSHDGELLYMTENAFDHGIGVIGIYDATRDYMRLGEFSSGGIGPHEVKILNKENTLIVANGGVKTHPDTGRSKLNLDTMQTNLSYIDAGSGEVQDLMQIGKKGNQSSIRHIDVSRDNQVAYAVQYFGKPTEKPELIGISRKGKMPNFIPMQKPLLKTLKNYCGSIVISPDGRVLAASAPRGNTVVEFDFSQQAWRSFRVADGCGLHYQKNNTLCISSGTGLLARTTSDPKSDIGMEKTHITQVQWDNHLG